jgi:hypothetical protein
MSTKKKGRKPRSDLENLFPMFQKAYAENKYLDVSKLNSNGTGSRVYELCQTSCRDTLRTKKHINGLNIVSNNYPAYRLAINILKKDANYSNLDQYAQLFANTYGTGVIESPRRSPNGVKSPKSPKYTNKPVVGLPTNLLTGQTGFNLHKSPRPKNTPAPVMQSSNFNVFNSPQIRAQSPVLNQMRQSPVLNQMRQSPVLNQMRQSPIRSSLSPLLTPGTQSSKIQNLLRENNKIQY